MEAFFIAARTLQFAGAISLTGVFAFECLVAGPACRRSGLGAANAAGLRRQLQFLAWASLVLAIGSGAVSLIAVAAGMSRQPLGIALCQNVVPVVLTRTQFGQNWLLRFALLGLVGSCLFALQGLRRVSGAIGWAALLLSALMLVSLAWAGHGAATPGPPGDLHLAGDIFHLLAAGLWLGTLPPLILLLAEARRIGDTNWARVARTATRRYSTLAMMSVTVLLATGVVNTWFLAGTVPTLVGTQYGRLLLVKIWLFIAMLMIAAVNFLRFTPRLAGPSSATHNAAWRTVARLRDNAWIEVGLGFSVLAIVGLLGTLPPGLHTEPGWPFPFRLDIGALTVGSQILLTILTVAGCVSAIASVVTAAAGYYRPMAAFAAGVVLCLAVAWVPLRSALERAYPTSYYAPTQPYATASIVRGTTLYAENCALCHGADGHGDGPAAAGLPIRPADLSEPHLFAHSPGDLFWWISHGRDDGVMPGFAGVLSSNQRWDVINFIRARAAGALAMRIGPEVTTGAAPEVPDFVFEAGDQQKTLRQMLETGPVLLVLFTPPVPIRRLQQLMAAQPLLDASGLRVVAVGLSPSSETTLEEGHLPPLVGEVLPEVTAALAPFLVLADSEEAELMLDRAKNIRARWTSAMPGGLPSPTALVVAAERVARISITTPSHPGHPH
jgi:putative copper resistance protein D